MQQLEQFLELPQKFFLFAGPAQSGILSDREVVNLFLHFTVNPKPKVDYIDRPRCCLRGKECSINRFQQVESRWGYSGTSDRIRYGFGNYLKERQKCGKKGRVLLNFCFLAEDTVTNTYQRTKFKSLESWDVCCISILVLKYKVLICFYFSNTKKKSSCYFFFEKPSELAKCHVIKLIDTLIRWVFSLLLTCKCGTLLKTNAMLFLVQLSAQQCESFLLVREEVNTPIIVAQIPLSASVLLGSQLTEEFPQWDLDYMDLFMDPRTTKLIYRYSIFYIQLFKQKLCLIQKVWSIFGQSRSSLIGQESNLFYPQQS